MGHNQELGAAGEQWAVRHLLEQGWHILDRNWRCREGEIDIVALDGATLVCLEVKTRRTHRYGHPAEAITAPKLKRMRTLCARWLSAHHVSVQQLRLDVISLTWPRCGEVSLEHFKGVGA